MGDDKGILRSLGRRMKRRGEGGVEGRGGRRVGRNQQNTWDMKLKRSYGRRRHLQNGTGCVGGFDLS